MTEPSYSEQLSPDAVRTLPGSLSGRALVGIHLGRGSGRFAIENIGIALPLAPAAREFCVRIASADARYYSVNRYRKAEEGGSAPRVETRSRFRDELARRYAADDVILRIGVASDCGGALEQALIPAKPPGADRADRLIAFVNGIGSRATVKLLGQSGDVLATGSCTMAHAAVLLFTEMCEIPLGEAEKRNGKKLQVVLLGEGEQVFDLQLPEP